MPTPEALSLATEIVHRQRAAPQPGLPQAPPWRGTTGTFRAPPPRYEENNPWGFGLEAGRDAYQAMRPYTPAGISQDLGNAAQAEVAAGRDPSGWDRYAQGLLFAPAMAQSIPEALYGMGSRLMGAAIDPAVDESFGFPADPRQNWDRIVSEQMPFSPLVPSGSHFARTAADILGEYAGPSGLEQAMMIGRTLDPASQPPPASWMATADRVTGLDRPAPGSVSAQVGLAPEEAMSRDPWDVTSQLGLGVAMGRVPKPLRNLTSQVGGLLGEQLDVGVPRTLDAFARQMGYRHEAPEVKSGSKPIWETGEYVNQMGGHGRTGPAPPEPMRSPVPYEAPQMGMERHRPPDILGRRDIPQTAGALPESSAMQAPTWRDVTQPPQPARPFELAPGLPPELRPAGTPLLAKPAFRGQPPPTYPQLARGPIPAKAPPRNVVPRGEMTFPRSGEVLNPGDTRPSSGMAQSFAPEPFWPPKLAAKTSPPAKAPRGMPGELPEPVGRPAPGAPAQVPLSMSEPVGAKPVAKPPLAKATRRRKAPGPEIPGVKSSQIPLGGDPNLVSRRPVKVTMPKERRTAAQKAAAARGEVFSDPKTSPKPRRVSSKAPKGKKVEIHGARTTGAVKGQWRVVELDDLVSSHDVDYRRNPNFPDAAQPRDFTATRRGKIDADTQKWEPARAMDAAEAQSGSPVIGPDMVVEAGNGRTIMLRRVADGSHKADKRAWAKYQAEIRAKARDLGIDPAKLEGMNRPVLVRQRTQRMTAAQRKRLAQEWNERISQEMGLANQARVDADSIPDDVLDEMRPVDIGHTENRRFLEKIVKKMAGEDADAFFDAKGRLHDTGRRRIVAALGTKVYGEKVSRILTELIGTEGMQRAVEAIISSLPEMAHIKRKIASGAWPQHLDISKDVAVAIEKLHDIKSQKKTIREWAQAVMPGFEDVSKFQRDLVMDLGGIGSKKKARQLMSAFADAVEAKAHHAKQETMKGFEAEKIPSGEEIWAEVKLEGDLFGMAPKKMADSIKKKGIMETLSGEDGRGSMLQGLAGAIRLYDALVGPAEAASRAAMRTVGKAAHHGARLAEKRYSIFDKPAVRAASKVRGARDKTLAAFFSKSLDKASDKALARKLKEWWDGKGKALYEKWLVDDPLKGDEMGELIDMHRQMISLVADDARRMNEELRSIIGKDPDVMVEVFERFAAGRSPGAPVYSKTPTPEIAKIMKQVEPIFRKLDDFWDELHEIAPDWVPEKFEESRQGYLPFLYGGGGPLNLLAKLVTGEHTTIASMVERLGGDAMTAAKLRKELAPHGSMLDRLESLNPEISYAERVKAGLIRDPAYAFARGYVELGMLVEIRKMQNALSNSERVLNTAVDQKKVDFYKMQKEAKKNGDPITDDEMKFYKDAAAEAEKNLKALKDEAKKKGWVRMNGGVVTEAGSTIDYSRVYGPLEYAYVDPSVFREVVDISRGFMDLESKYFMARAMSKVLGLWKGGRVATSVHTVMSNTVGNILQGDLGGFSAWDQIPFLTKARLELKKADRQIYREAVKDGLSVQAGFIDHATKSAFEAMDNALRASSDVGPHATSTSASMSLAAKLMMGGVNAAKGTGRFGAKGFRAATEFYNSIDVTFKLAHYMHAKEVRGLSGKAAAESANAVHLDYAKAPTWVKGANRYWHPFALFAWKMPKTMAKLAYNHPLRLGKWMMAAYAMDALGEALSEDDVSLVDALSPEGMRRRRKQRANMPAGWAQKLSRVRMPFKLETGNRADWDLLRALPLFELYGRQTEGVELPTTPFSILSLTNPILTGFIEYQHGRDLWTGKDIERPGMSGTQRAASWVEHYAREASPKIFLDAERFIDVARGDRIRGSDRTVPGYLLEYLMLAQENTKWEGTYGRKRRYKAKKRELKSEFRQKRRRSPQDARVDAVEHRERKRRLKEDLRGDIKGDLNP